MALETYFVNYITDTEDLVFVKIKYDDNSPLTPSQRLARGGFSAQDTLQGSNCLFVLNRKDLMPRYIDFVESGGFNQPNKRVRVFYRDHDRWINDIKNRSRQVASADGERLNCRAVEFVRS
ncbi:hypothetical protein AA637_11840 [Cyanobacterium sp. HL-69]|uniref:hypothetical protein n=1 Tax=Cyanobacterium sp. HL-69 TaxID=2054282 RepID=UPI000CA33A66|nr:hypothetical protein AA637_11840 [Cyanobacterium sp. HL-69]